MRKDGITPYFSHVFRVCLVVRHVFEIDDPSVMMAAALHDTVEDTRTDFDDLAERFGPDVAGWVAALSKDKRLPEAPREQAYAAQLSSASWQVAVCKLADIFDNLMDSIHTSTEQQAKTFQNARRYLTALHGRLPEPARNAWGLVSELLAAMEGSAASK
jgi:guanosine-3',5'-bis(diphosphate) 3'-pyrophosphohydrolase